MKLVATKLNLLAALSRPVAIARQRQTLPILNSLLVSAPLGDRASFAATDLFTSCTSLLDGETTEAGSFCVSASDLFDRVKLMPEGAVSIATQGDSLVVTSGKRRFVLALQSADDFPAIDASAHDFVEADGAALASLIGRVFHAVSLDTSRAHLHAVLLERDGEKLRAVAMDGHRLAYADDASMKGTVHTSLLSRGAADFIRKAVDGAAAVSLSLSDRVVAVKADDSILTTRCVEATFPPYYQVIPQRHATTARCSRAAIIDVVRAVNSAAQSWVDKNNRQGFKATRMQFSASSLRVSAEGLAEDEMPIECDGGVSIGFNGTYLLDALSALSGDEVTIGMSGELDPMTMRGDGLDLQLVMPARL